MDKITNLASNTYVLIKKGLTDLVFNSNGNHVTISYEDLSLLHSFITSMSKFRLLINKNVFKLVSVSKDTVLKNIYLYEGANYEAVIKGYAVSGRLNFRSDGSVYLCNNNDNCDGSPGRNKYGYKYSWYWDRDVSNFKSLSIAEIKKIKGFSELADLQKKIVELGKKIGHLLSVDEKHVYIGCNTFSVEDVSALCEFYSSRKIEVLINDVKNIIDQINSTVESLNSLKIKTESLLKEEPKVSKERDSNGRFIKRK